MWDDFILFVLVGFAAQVIDGSIGMAYGLTATTVLLSLGYPPVTASSSSHAAEVFTTGASGLAHWRFGNIDFSILWKLALPGMIGGGHHLATGTLVALLEGGDVQEDERQDHEPQKDVQPAPVAPHHGESHANPVLVRPIAGPQKDAF